MVKRVRKDHPEIDSDKTFKLEKFKNINGEGVVAKI